MLFAYLDPGSGSALLGTIFALFGAVLFSLKGLVYRLLGKDSSQGAKNPKTIAIFSEGKNYWGTFKPIVDELLRRKIPFAYYTYGLDDPALKIDSPYMFARLYNKDIVSSYVKLSNIEAQVCLSTTPNIGTPGYPITRSKKIKNLVHVFHSADDILSYRKGSLDHYDSVLTVGSFQDSTIRELEEQRGLPPKELHLAGAPYLDDLLETLKVLPPPTTNLKQSKTILIAPSWGDKGCMGTYGIDFVLELAKEGYRIIFRPHPHSWIAEADLVAEWKKATAPYENIEWDAHVRPIESLRLADILISDLSSVRFDFAYIFKRPVITLDVPITKNKDCEGYYLSTTWVVDVSPRLGKVLTKETIQTLPSVVKEFLDHPPTLDIQKFREENLVNFGSAASAVVDYLVSQVK